MSALDVISEDKQKRLQAMLADPSRPRKWRVDARASSGGHKPQADDDPCRVKAVDDSGRVVGKFKSFREAANFYKVNYQTLKSARFFNARVLKTGGLRFFRVDEDVPPPPRPLVKGVVRSDGRVFEKMVDAVPLPQDHPSFWTEYERLRIAVQSGRPWRGFTYKKLRKETT